MQKITPFLWFDNQAEEAVRFYISVFKNGKITHISRYGKEGYEIHHMKEGTVMSVGFEIEGQQFTAINGGPVFKFNESISFVINCTNQKEVDYYWNELAKGGDEKAQQCGWLKDRFGVSWQVVPTVLGKLLGDADPVKSGKVMQAMLKMKKIDIKKLEQARL